MIIRASLTTQINVHQQVVFFCVYQTYMRIVAKTRTNLEKENTHSFTPNNIASCFHAERSFDEC